MAEPPSPEFPGGPGFRASPGLRGTAFRLPDDKLNRFRDFAGARPWSTGRPPAAAPRSPLPADAQLGGSRRGPALGSPARAAQAAVGVKASATPFMQ